MHTPEWVKHAVFYQIFPDRFARGAHVEKPSNLEAWDTPPTLMGYKGGDLFGVIEHLDYLEHLGITAIYFTPIFQSAANHRYHTHDYYQVDPLLGGNRALYALLDAAHRRNIKIVLDGVFNHTSRGFFYFNDILENGPYSPWLDWFTIQGWPLSAYDGSKPAHYLAWAGNRALPRLNTDHHQVREYLMRVAEHWLRIGIDGWRLDVPFEITTPGFWQEFRWRVKSINPDAYIVGEIWDDARPWLQGDQFDGVMNYLFAAATIAFTAGERVVPDLVAGRSYTPQPALSAEEYADKMDWLLRLYPWEIQLTQFNLLDSHDTARLISIANGDAASVHLATLLLLSFPGAPAIYYGDEIGLPGAMDPDCRRTFPWDRPDTWNHETHAYHTRLIALRHTYLALRTGSFHRLYAADGVYVFARRQDEQVLVILVNSAQSFRSIAVELSSVAPAHGTALDLQIVYGEGTAVARHAHGSFGLPPRTGMIVLVGTALSCAYDPVKAAL